MSTEKKPFHESIVDAINNCFPNDLNTLASLIKVTIIPKNHAVIIAAWENRTKNMSFFWQDLIASIQEQQQLAEEKGKEWQDGIVILEEKQLAEEKGKEWQDGIVILP